MKAYTVFISITLSICFTFFACSEYLEENDIPRLTIDYYKTQPGIEAATIAAYGYMRPAAGAGGVAVFNILTEHGNDLITCGDSDGELAFNYYTSALRPSLDHLYKLWSSYYKGINAVNLVLYESQNSTSITNAQKQMAKAEMSFIRAYFYFDLVQQFGKIPLVLDASYEVRTDFQRSPVADIYKQIIEDLTFAAKYLREPSSGNAGRATRYSAAHLLSKVYLTR